MNAFEQHALEQHWNKEAAKLKGLTLRDCFYSEEEGALVLDFGQVGGAWAVSRDNEGSGPGALHKLIGSGGQGKPDFLPSLR